MAPLVNGSGGDATFTNGHVNGQTISHVTGRTNGSTDNYTSGYVNGDAGCEVDGSRIDTSMAYSFEPIAICGMACRLPGGIGSPQGLWEFLMEGRDGRIRVPKSRFNSKGYYSPFKRPSTTNVEYGYFLDESVDLAGLDTSFFSMGRSEVELLDPQQRLMLEVALESLDDAGEVGWAGAKIGVYVGSFGQDWSDICTRDELRSGPYTVTCSHDFMISERLSHEMDLRGPRYVSLLL